MTASTAIGHGLGMVHQNRKAVWVLLIFNLMLAAAAALPIYHGILNFTGHSLMSRTLASGFSIDWLTDFDHNHKGALDHYAGVVWWFALVSVPLNAVLSGGVIAGLRDPSMGFFHSAGRYAWRLLRLTILGLICYWIVFLLVEAGLGNLIDKWTRHWLADRPVFWVQLASGLLLVLGLGFVNLVMDYARVRLVMEDGFSAIEAFLASLGFSLRRFHKAALVYAVPSLCGLALLALYRVALPWSIINARIGSTSGPRWAEPLTLALLFVAQQAVMFGRYWFRVATWASEWSYYSAASRPPQEP